MKSALRHHWFLALTLLVVIPGAVYALMAAPAFKNLFVEGSRDAGFVLNSLRIEGLERAKRTDVLAALDVDTGMPLLAIDLGQIQEKLEGLNWVKRAEVTRVLPGELNIRITERQPYALWQERGKVHLIDPDGVVITDKGLGEFTHLMLVVGDGAQSKVKALQTMLEKAPALAARVRSAVRVGDRRWDLIFANGVRVKLPEETQQPYGAEAAWGRFVAYEAKHHLLEREISVIDMRMQDRMVLRVSPEGHRRMNGEEWAT